MTQAERMSAPLPSPSIPLHMARTKATLLTTLLVSLFGLVLFAPAQGTQQTSSSTMAFKKLQSLTGDWESTREHATTNFKVVVADTTVMETLAAHDMDEMLTLYTVDRDGIALVHYCPTNNQPRMRAVPQSGEVKELVFEFTGAGNLPELSMGHEHKLILRFEDENHMTEEWTWRKNGKDSVTVYHFVRKEK
jgi:hypothetical protein